MNNLYNNISATYYLFVYKKIRYKYDSVSDLFSKEYEDYIYNIKNKLKYYENDINEVLKCRISSKGKLKDIQYVINNIDNNNFIIL